MRHRDRGQIEINKRELSSKSFAFEGETLTTTRCAHTFLYETKTLGGSNSKQMTKRNVPSK